MADIIHSGLKLSRFLDEDELDEFERIRCIKVNDIAFIENRAVPTEREFYTDNHWEISSVRLLFSLEGEQTFFIETLYYIIKDFFQPNGIKLNGYVLAIDSLFGSIICIYVDNNNIYYLPDVINYFENLNLSDNYQTNFTLISEHMKNLIK